MPTLKICTNFDSVRVKCKDYPYPHPHQSPASPKIFSRVESESRLDFRIPIESESESRLGYRFFNRARVRVWNQNPIFIRAQVLIFVMLVRFGRIKCSSIITLLHKDAIKYQNNCRFVPIFQKKIGLVPNILVKLELLEELLNKI